MRLLNFQRSGFDSVGALDLANLRLPKIVCFNQNTTVVYMVEPYGTYCNWAIRRVFELGFASFGYPVKSLPLKKTYLPSLHLGSKGIKNDLHLSLYF